MSRTDTIKAERRRRTDNIDGHRRRLALSAELDTEKFNYRWVNDEGTRLHDLTVNDDYEVVQNREGDMKPDGTGVGSEVAVPVGMGEHGRPVRAVLLRKPKNWYDDDKRQEQRRIDETEASIKQGATPGAGDTAQTYVPRGGITITRA